MKFWYGSVALLFCSSFLIAADWPQWRGPQRTGISQETGLLKEWPEGGPKLLWQVKDIGDGYSTPAVVGDRLYLISNQGMDNEYVHCLSAADGKEIWRTTIGKVGPNEGPQYPAARSTPTVDGSRLFALGSNGDLACLETGGKLVWKKNIREEFGGQFGKWAYAESPLVDGDAVAVTPGGSEATLLKLSKATGEVIWKSRVEGGDKAGYASIIVVEAGGVRQYVQFLEKGLVGVDAKTGKFLWRYDQTAKGSPANIPTPVAKDAYVYSASNRGGAALVQLKGGTNAIDAEQVYASAQLPTAIGGAVLVGDYLYGTNGNSLICAEFASGDVKWQDRGVGSAASLCVADGRLYLHGENGVVALVEATPEGYREKGKFTPPGIQPRGSVNSKAWAYPVVSSGKLYIRDLGVVWCYDVSAK